MFHKLNTHLYIHFIAVSAHKHTHYFSLQISPAKQNRLPGNDWKLLSKRDGGLHWSFGILLLWVYKHNFLKSVFRFEIWSLFINCLSKKFQNVSKPKKKTTIATKTKNSQPAVWSTPTLSVLASFSTTPCSTTKFSIHPMKPANWRERRNWNLNHFFFVVLIVILKIIIMIKKSKIQKKDLTTPWRNWTTFKNRLTKIPLWLCNWFATIWRCGLHTSSRMHRELYL